MYPFAILIGGPTAIGKTRLAFEIQRKIKSFIVNADSMQIYNRLNDLTNVPSKLHLKNYSCELFSFLKYPKKCNLGIWNKSVKKLLIKYNDSVPIFVGGTGLYLDSLFGKVSPIPKISMKIIKKVEELYSRLGKDFFYKKLQKIDYDYSQKISKNDSQRILRAVSVKIGTGKNLSYWHKKFSNKFFKKILYVVICDDRDVLYDKINKRCSYMLKSGVVEEVDEFMKEKKNIHHPLHKAIGLSVIEKYIKGEIDFDSTLDSFSTDTRRYAKRQMTWFKNKSIESVKMNYSDAKEFILKNI